MGISGGHFGGIKILNPGFYEFCIEGFEFVLFFGFHFDYYAKMLIETTISRIIIATEISI